jgi:hypothetical protein
VVVRLLHNASGIDPDSTLGELGLVPRGSVTASLHSDEDRGKAMQQVPTQNQWELHSLVVSGVCV